MNIYVASSWRNERQPAIVRALRDEQFQVYDFRNPAPDEHGFSWKQCQDEPPPWRAEKTREVLDHELAVKGFFLDFSAMQAADAIVMVQPCGRSAALEFGWAAGAGKFTVALLDDFQEPELMLKMANRLVTTVEELVQVMRDYRSAKSSELRKLEETMAAVRANARHAEAMARARDEFFEAALAVRRNARALANAQRDTPLNVRTAYGIALDRALEREEAAYEAIVALEPKAQAI